MTDQVEALLREYTVKLRAVFRGQLEEDVTAAVRKAFSGTGAPANRSDTAGKGMRPPKTKTPARTKRGKGGKRSPEQMAKQAERLLAYISANPGQRSEQIAEGTKFSTGELALPLRKLVADKKLKSTGKARGTMYTVAK